MKLFNIKELDDKLQFECIVQRAARLGNLEEIERLFGNTQEQKTIEIMRSGRKEGENK